MNPNNTVSVSPSLVRVGKTLGGWDDWVSRWNDECVTLSEQMGLLHGAFDIKLESDDPRAITRLSFFLRLANSAAQDRPHRDAGGEKLAEKARGVIVAKVIRGETLGRHHLSFVYGGPSRDELLPLMISLFCDRDEKGWCNWRYVRERSEGDFLNHVLSDHFSVLVRHVTKEFGPGHFRTSVIGTCFLEAPEAFCNVLGRVGDRFGYDDFKALVDWLGAGKADWPLSIPEMIMSGQVRESVRFLVEEKTGGRLIASQIRHWEAFILFATRAQEDLLRIEAQSA